MGIRFLNKYIKEQCSHATKECHLKNLRSKKVVIDTSIYLYKFKEKEALIENFYLLITIFREFKILPLFIFDGKPPALKNDEIKKRSKNKQEAKDKISILNDLLLIEKNNQKRNNLLKEIEDLSKKCIYITKDDIKNVKELFNAYGVMYLDAEGEADKMCAHYIKNKSADACLSDDMDMFVYGCKEVWRDLDIDEMTVTVYDTKKILKNFYYNKYLFNQICILSGSDYTLNCKNNLFDNIKLCNKYLKEYPDMEITFIDWLKKINFINEYEFQKIHTINVLFTIPNSDLLEKKKFSFLSKNKPLLKKILSDNGFIFV